MPYALHITVIKPISGNICLSITYSILVKGNISYSNSYRFTDHSRWSILHITWIQKSQLFCICPVSDILPFLHIYHTRYPTYPAHVLYQISHLSCTYPILDIPPTLHMSCIPPPLHIPIPGL